nr:serine/arginine repetitive matrix protein 1-like [Aegilops tauschii subsp. strangulata]
MSTAASTANPAPPRHRPSAPAVAARRGPGQARRAHRGPSPRPPRRTLPPPFAAARPAPEAPGDPRLRRAREPPPPAFYAGAHAIPRRRAGASPAVSGRRSGQIRGVFTEMYSMPNGEQVQEQEGEVSGGESSGWQSDGGEDEESDDPSDGEEVDSPPRTESRSKHTHDPASIRGKATAQIGQTSKHTRTASPVPTEKAPKQPKVMSQKPRKALPKIKVAVPIASGAATSGTSVYKDDEDEEMEDAVTSNPAPPNVIELPDDDEDAPLKHTEGRSRTLSKNASTNKTPQSTPATEPVIQRSEDINRASVTFVVPLSSAQPSASTAQAPTDPPPSLFTAHHVPEDQKSCELGARFADLEQKQIQLNLDLELAKTTLQKAKDKVAETMNQALAKKDLDLAAAQKAAEEKTALDDQKLASVGKLEEENAKLKTAHDEANKEATRLKKDKRTLTEKSGRHRSQER